MAKQVIDISTAQPNGGVGEPIKTAFQKVNANFNEVYGDVGTKLSRSDIVGNVSNGAIIERGSNANGEYVKFADGTMICTGVVTDGYYANGSNFTFNIVYPSQFAVKPAYLVCTLVRRAREVGETKLWQSGSSNTIIINSLAMTTAQVFLMFSGGVVAQGDKIADLQYTAVGRWK